MAPNKGHDQKVHLKVLTFLARLARPHPTLLWLIRNNPMGPHNAWRWLLPLAQSNPMSLRQYGTVLQSFVLLLGMTGCPRELTLDLYRFIPTLIHTLSTCQQCGLGGVAVLRPVYRSLGLVSTLVVSLLLSYHQGLIQRPSVTQGCCLMLSLMLASLSQFLL
uniref:Hypothetial protein n=1 Tax=Sapovirus Hu/Yokote1/06/JP TaxID=376900 RepID=Q25BN3_9CALI|nr:hypothetial protein [Sapovirus Hu/Yokote1/06/JP]